MAVTLPSDPTLVASCVLEAVLASPPTLGAGWLICIDGPAGSGKTTLATSIARALPTAQVVHCDEMLEGWHGLSGLARAVSSLLGPLAVDATGTWRRWDWSTDAWAETRSVDPGGLLVLEGVGSWSPQIASLATMLVWVEAPSPVRLERGLTRDGEHLRAQWMQWRKDESEHFVRSRTREHADLHVSTTD